MIDKRLIFLGLFCIWVSLVCNAELSLLPSSDSVIELNLLPGQSGVVDITVQNLGAQTLTDIVPESDLPGSFSLPAFGLDPGQSRTFSFLVTPEGEDVSGVVSVGDQYFLVKVKIVKDFGVGSFLTAKEYHVGEFVVPRDLFFAAIALVVIVVGGAILLKVKTILTGTMVAVILFAVIVISGLMLVLSFA